MCWWWTDRDRVDAYRYSFRSFSSNSWLEVDCCKLCSYDSYDRRNRNLQMTTGQSVEECLRHAGAHTHRRTTAKHNASRGLNVYSMGMHESTTNLSMWPTGADLHPKTRLTTTTWHYISKCISYIYNNICSVDFFETRPAGITRGHPYKLYKRHSCCSTRSSFFSERIVNAWNNLPVDT